MTPPEKCGGCAHGTALALMRQEVASNHAAVMQRLDKGEARFVAMEALLNHLMEQRQQLAGVVKAGRAALWIGGTLAAIAAAWRGVR